MRDSRELHWRMASSCCYTKGRETKQNYLEVVFSSSLLTPAICSVPALKQPTRKPTRPALLRKHDQSNCLPTSHHASAQERTLLRPVSGRKDTSSFVHRYQLDRGSIEHRLGGTWHEQRRRRRRLPRASERYCEPPTGQGSKGRRGVKERM